MNKIILYTTLGCHLCDHAKDLLWPALQTHHLRLEEVDIADSDQLMSRFGTAIPVVENPRQNTLLYWPFSAEQLHNFLIETS